MLNCVPLASDSQKARWDGPNAACPPIPCMSRERASGRGDLLIPEALLGLGDCRVTSFLATSANLAAFSPRRVEKEEKESRLAASVTCQVPQAYRMLS